MQITPEATRKNVQDVIEKKLNALGLMYRVFSRSKTLNSLKEKIGKDKSYGSGKKITDFIGVRVVVYFPDDIKTVHKIVSSVFSECKKDESIDEYKTNEFSAVRYNIVYELDNQSSGELDFGEYKDFLDHTFELQIRTIFSEGWHEVEHDLRYKCLDDWSGVDNHSRTLNGVYAALETSEWTMVKVFEELSYTHYQNASWEAMFRQKFRLRLIDYSIDEKLLEVFNNDRELVKKFFRLNRSNLIEKMNDYGFFFPLSLNNIIYFSNLVFVKEDKISNFTPGIMISTVQEFLVPGVQESIYLE